MTMNLLSITFDCDDAHSLASFWGAVLERPLADGPSKEYAALEGPDGAPAWTFYRVPEAKTAKNRVHVDLGVDGLAGEVERIVGLGARRLGDFAEGGYAWVTLADPEGNEFDVVAPA